jgi:hypothetical protein
MGVMLSENRNRRALGQAVLQIVVGLAVVAGSFWATLLVMDRLGYDPSSATIEVLDATYGANA